MESPVMSSRIVTIRGIVALGLAAYCIVAARSSAGRPCVLVRSLCARSRHFGAGISCKAQRGIWPCMDGARRNRRYSHRPCNICKVGDNRACTDVLDRDLGNHHRSLRDRRCQSYAQEQQACMAVWAGWRTLGFLWDTVYWSAAGGRLGRDLVVGRLRPAVWRCLTGLELQASQT